MAFGQQRDHLLNDVSTVLWRERHLLELLVFKLEEERLLLTAGKVRWVNHASREVEIVLEQLRAAELFRAVKVEAAALEFGLETCPGLRSLSQAAPEPWSSIFSRHRQACLELTGEVRDLSERNRQMLAKGRDAAREALNWLTGKGAPPPQGYTASGAPTQGPGGYDEETIELGAVPATQTIGSYTNDKVPGCGVAVEGADYVTDRFRQSQSYTEQGNLGVLSAQQSGLQAVQLHFREPSSNGISGQLTQYWQDWSALANNPSDSSAQATVVQDGSNLASSLNDTSSALSTLSQQTAQNITLMLVQVNQEASQVASLNQSISRGNAPTSSVEELEDQRDQLVSELSRQLGVIVVNNPDGTVNVSLGSEAIVSGDISQALSLTTSRAAPYSLEWSKDKSTHQPSGGELAGMLDVVNEYIPSYQRNLDQVAQSLMGSVNYLMSQGYDQAGNQGAPFFLGTGASDIEVNPVLLANPADIGANASPLPAGSSATNEDGTVAAEVGELPNSQTVTMSVPAGGWPQGGSASAWTGATTTTGVEPDVAHNQLVAGIGQAAASVNNQLTDQQAITTNVSSALQSATGLNADQELTNMVMYQNAYEASAKFISTVGATLQSLISLVNG